jgi:hypothetical protein
MPTVSIFHNISRDASFGLNTVFRTGSEAPEGVRSVTLSDGRVSWKEQAATPDEQHELVFVFTYEGEGSSTELERIFEEFNVGGSALAHQYRARKLRSLSVGDVVVIGNQIWSCESCGWAERKLSDLRILPAREAEAVVRERFEFRRTEPLSISVPLAD